MKTALPILALLFLVAGCYIAPPPHPQENPGCDPESFEESKRYENSTTFLVYMGQGCGTEDALDFAQSQPARRNPSYYYFYCQETGFHTRLVLRESQYEIIENRIGPCP